MSKNCFPSCNLVLEKARNEQRKLRQRPYSCTQTCANPTSRDHLLSMTKKSHKITNRTRLISCFSCCKHTFNKLPWDDWVAENIRWNVVFPFSLKILMFAIANLIISPQSSLSLANPVVNATAMYWPEKNWSPWRRHWLEVAVNLWKSLFVKWPVWIKMAVNLWDKLGLDTRKLQSLLSVLKEDVDFPGLALVNFLGNEMG